MIGKKINQLATELAPVSTDLTIIGDPTTGVSKKITLAQLGAIFSGAVAFYTNLAGFPATGDINIIYCAKDTQKLYLWSGSAYVEVFPSQALLDTYQLRSEKGNANGYASLDSLGKVPISQLPSSIMEYKGTWNAATNTPTLANGTGDTGDVYICNVAGTVNFGAGNITFAVGDYVIYSGTIWQRSSGAVGTVTSVALTVGGDAISVSGSPLTTSGTLGLTFNGTTAQYIRGNGTLETFPSLTGFVPYTGATANLDLGTHTLIAAKGTFSSSGSSDTVGITHSSGSGIALNITKGGNGEGLYINKTSGSGNAATIIGTLNATTLVKSGGTSSQFLKADGSVDSTSYGTGSVTSVGLSSATSGVTIGSTPITTSGTITLAIATASGSQQGLLSSTDWTTFNNKQSALTNPVTGTGTTNYLPKFTGASTIGNSQVFDNGTNVGIGTATPTAKLHIQQTSDASRVTGIIMQNVGSSANTAVSLDFAPHENSSSPTILARINAVRTALSNAPTDLVFSTFNSSLQERMRLNASGNLGLGTSSINGKLQVKSGTNQNLVIGTQGGELSFEVVNDAYSANTPIRYYASTHNWYTGGSLKATLDASGNLGLGVTPSAWFTSAKVIQVLGAALEGRTTVTQLWCNGYVDAGASGNFYQYNGFASKYTQVNSQHQWYTAPSGTAGNTISFTQAMTLDASGNLMVGGTSVYGATITSYGSATRSGGIGIRNSAGTVAGFFGTYASGSGSGSTDIFAESAGFMAFASGGSERLRITSGGNVGIGNTSPGNLLTLYSASSAIYTQWVQSGTGTSSTDGLRIGLDASSNGIINLNEGTALITSIDGTERMRITSGGLVGIGTSSPTAPLTVAGNISLGNRASSGTSYIGKLREDNGGIANAYGIGFVNSDINGAGYINFYTTPVGGSGDTRMTITGAGNVGLGTTAPNSLLEVNRTITFSSIDTYGQLVVKTTSGANGRLLNIGVDETNGVSFIQSLNRGTDAMPLSLQRYGGAVLIGTTTEGFLGKLQVAGSVAITGQYNTVLPSSSFSYFDGSGQVVSSSSNASALYLDTTWNTTGNPDGIYLNVTNTASGASSKLLNLKVGSVSQFSVSKAGAIQTTAPSSGSAQPWKLGSYAAGGTGTATGVIYIEINGQIYSIPALQGTP